MQPATAIRASSRHEAGEDSGRMSHALKRGTADDANDGRRRIRLHNDFIAQYQFGLSRSPQPSSSCRASRIARGHGRPVASGQEAPVSLLSHVAGELYLQGGGHEVETNRSA